MKLDFRVGFSPTKGDAGIGVGWNAVCRCIVHFLNQNATKISLNTQYLTLCTCTPCLSYNYSGETEKEQSYFLPYPPFACVKHINELNVSIIPLLMMISDVENYVDIQCGSNN